MSVAGGNGPLTETHVKVYVWGDALFAIILLQTRPSEVPFT